MWVFLLLVGCVLMLYSGSDWTQGLMVSGAEAAMGVA